MSWTRRSHRFTIKAEGEGTGLWLATVHDVITQAGGTAYLVSEMKVQRVVVARAEDASALDVAPEFDRVWWRTCWRQ
jgi:hypothetical protein